VVANEVKNLANQTARATEDITAQIAGVQSRTDQAVTAIANIAGIIEKMNGISGAIAMAVEQQGAATQEISRNIQQAHAGTTDVAINIAGVGDGAQESSSAASQVLSSASELHHQTESLRDTVGRVLDKVRESASSIQWNEAWLTGHAVIDADHAKLVEYINDLSRSALNKVPRSVLKEQLGRLTAFALEHFTREEGIWSNGGLLSIDEHKAVHAKLICQVADFQSRFNSGQAEIDARILAFLRDWLVDHVFTTDKTAVHAISVQNARSA
jgi:methyl-accepting chemotaxis protein